NKVEMEFAITCLKQRIGTISNGNYFRGPRRMNQSSQTTAHATRSTGFRFVRADGGGTPAGHSKRRKTTKPRRQRSEVCFHQRGSRLGAANARRNMCRLLCGGFFRGSFLRSSVFQRSLLRGFLGSRGTRAAAGVEIELAHLIQQRFVADAEHLRRVFAAPIGFLERVGDG